jgi:hypothetical protein
MAKALFELIQPEDGFTLRLSGEQEMIKIAGRSQRPWTERVEKR